MEFPKLNMTVLHQLSEPGSRRSTVVGGVRVLCAVLFLGLSQSALAQSANIEFSTERNYVHDNTINGLLPFVVSINNPAASVLRDVQLTITMPAAVNLGNVDKECTETAAAGVRALNCTVPAVAAFSTKLLDFFVDGPNSDGAGPEFVVSLSSVSLPVIEPDAFTASLADGDRRISGSNLRIHLIRDITLDINRNGVSDIDEAIMQLPANTPVEQLLSRLAVVDVLFLYTPAAEQYLGNKLASRISQFVTATNQVFRENAIALQFNGVGLAPVPYTTTNTTLPGILNTIQADSDIAFETLDQLVTSSGGDVVVLLHALDPGSDTFCGYGASVAVGRQGDFRSEYHQGELVSVLNIGPDCLGLNDLSPLFATNMGIVATREIHPDGGTFSYSAGYVATDLFATLTAQLGALNFGNAEVLNRFSNPAQLCKSLPCGIDKTDIARGADAASSLQATRHMVSALTPSKFPVDPDSLPQRKTISRSLNYDIEVTQTSTDIGALYNEFTEVLVNITNVSGETLENLDVSFRHLDGGLLSAEAQVYENAESACRILGAAVTTVGIPVGDATRKLGTLNCFIESLEPGQSMALTYRIQIDTTPPVLGGESYYHEIVYINGIAQLESAMCLPVYANFVLANAGSNVCDSVQVLLPGVSPNVPLDLNALPSVTGSMLSLPFLRLYDGSLISAELRITLAGPVELEIVSYADLDPDLIPVYEAHYDLAGVLNIHSLAVDTAAYDIRATYVPDSNPIRFTNLIATLLAPTP